MVTEEELFSVCPPRRPLEVISQYDREISRVKAAREGLETYNPPRDAADLRNFLETQLETTDILHTTPFELLTRIHEPEGYVGSRMRTEPTPSVIRGKSVLPLFTEDVGRIREVSKPVHTRNGDEFFVATPFRTVPLTPEDLEKDYFVAVRSARPEFDTMDQVATYEDIIAINRRVIDKNIRCIPCQNTSGVTCFKYDWPEEKIL